MHKPSDLAIVHRYDNENPGSFKGLSKSDDLGASVEKRGKGTEKRADYARSKVNAVSAMGRSEWVDTRMELKACNLQVRHQ